MQSLQQYNVYDNEYVVRYLRINTFRIIREGRRSIAPPKNISVSDWAEENRMLPENAYLPGKWMTINAPHTREIMDAGSDSEVKELTIMGSSQIAKTESVLNIVGRRMDVDPCDMMIMHPTDKDVRKFVDRKLDPMIDETPCLRKIVKSKKKKDGTMVEEKSTYRKKFIGGSLYVITGRSTSSTRSSTVKLTWDDDIDAIEIGHTKEGDPCERLKKRSTVFEDRLNIHSSTPSREGLSRIQKYYNDSDGRHYFVKCPFCHHQQELIPEQLYWEKERDMFKRTIGHYEETVKYKCINPECQKLITEGQRKEILRSGFWIKSRPHIKHHAGFFISEVSSTLSSMESIARQITGAKVDIIFDEKSGRGQLDISKADKDKLESLFNTCFGRTFENVIGEETDPVELMERIEDFIDIKNIIVPKEVVLLTAFVDLQAGMGNQEQRLEIKVMGWGVGEESWIIYLGKIPGDLQKKAVWKELDKFWERIWKRDDGVEMTIKIKLIDSGYLAQTVYDYVRGRRTEGIYASKGANKYGASLLQRKLSLVDKGRCRLIIIGTQAAKQIMFDRFNKIKEPGPGYTHFPKCFCNAAYFKQLTAEVAVRHTTELVDFYVYEKKDKLAANEAIDEYVGCYAAMKMYTTFVKLETLEHQLKRRIVKNDRQEIKTDAKTEANESNVISTQSGRRRRRTTGGRGNLDSWRYS